jgi:hypothetical protein
MIERNRPATVVPHDCVHTVERDQHGGFIRIAVMGDPVHQRPSLFDERLHVAAELVILFARAKLAHKHPVPSNGVGILWALIIFIELVVIPQPDGSSACIPAWMMHEAAAHCRLCAEPQFSLDILRSLRADIAALLAFLQSDSRMEKDGDDAPIRESPAEPVRRGRASRRAGKPEPGRASRSFAACRRFTCRRRRRRPLRRTTTSCCR